MSNQASLSRKTLLIASLALLLIIVVVGGALLLSRNDSAAATNPSQVNQNQQKVIVTIQGKGNSAPLASYSLDYREKESATDLLRRLASINSGFSFTTKQYDFGLMITTINDQAADATKEFWQFDVNGQESVVGISDYPVKPGDQLSFALVTF